MPDVRVEVCRDGDGERLLETFEARGLTGRLVKDGIACELVEVAYASPEEDRLTVDVQLALETWIGEQDVPLVPTRADGGFVLHPPGD